MRSFNKILLVRMSFSLRKIAHPRASCPPWRLKYIEALLRRENKEIKLIDLSIDPMLLNELLDISYDWKPDLLIFSSTITDYDFTVEFVGSIKAKRRDLIIIGVGEDPTTRPHNYSFNHSPVDFILPGEAEFQIVDLLKSLDGGHPIEEIKGSYLNDNQSFKPIVSKNLDSLPFPVWSKEELRKYRLIYPIRTHKKLVWGQVLSGRGCSHKCIFCSPILRYSYGEAVRLRSAKNVVDEIEYLKNVGANIISFEDDDFTISKKHIISVCKEIKERNLEVQWISHARIDEVTPELLTIMKEGGCVLLRFGVESGSERIVKILNKFTSKMQWTKKSREVFRQTKDLGIMTHAMFIIGNPQETEEDVWKSINLAKELDPDIIQVSFFTLYPGSIGYVQYKDKVLQGKDSHIYHYASPVVNLSAIENKRLLELQGVFYRAFFLRLKFVVAHIRKYIFFYLYNSGSLFELLKARKIFLK